MLTRVRPARRAITRLALASAAAGVLADVLLVAFFVAVFGLGQNQYEWLGAANDVAIMVQFLALIPVTLALAEWLRPWWSVGVATAAAVVAMGAVVVLQLLLVLGVLAFEVQVLLVVPAILIVFGWVLTVSSVGHRAGVLPRPVTRFGLVLGAAFPVGMLIFTAGLPFGWNTSSGLVFTVLGGALGGLSWLALPAWPYLLARYVFHPLPEPVEGPITQGEHS